MSLRVLQCVAACCSNTDTSNANESIYIYKLEERRYWCHCVCCSVLQRVAVILRPRMQMNVYAYINLRKGDIDVIVREFSGHTYSNSYILPNSRKNKYFIWTELPRSKWSTRTQNLQIFGINLIRAVCNILNCVYANKSISESYTRRCAFKYWQYHINSWDVGSWGRFRLFFLIYFEKNHRLHNQQYQ